MTGTAGIRGARSLWIAARSAFRARRNGMLLDNAIAGLNTGAGKRLYFVCPYLLRRTLGQALLGRACPMRQGDRPAYGVADDSSASVKLTFTPHTVPFTEN